MREMAPGSISLIGKFPYDYFVREGGIMQGKENAVSAHKGACTACA
jgi:hypothetical protein